MGGGPLNSSANAPVYSGGMSGHWQIPSDHSMPDPYSVQSRNGDGGYNSGGGDRFNRNGGSRWNAAPNNLGGDRHRG